MRVQPITESSKPPVHGSNHTLTYTLDTVPPSLRNEQTIPGTNLTLQSFICPERAGWWIPNSLFERCSLSAFHHLRAPHGRVCSSSDTILDVVEDGIAQVRLEETDVLSSGQLYEEMRIGIAVQRCVSWSAAQPDTRVVDITFAGF